MQLRRHQTLAIAALEQAWAAERTRSLVVLPPGAGKTLLGLEAVRRLVAAGDVGRGVVLGPNTAIQGQWVAQAAQLGLEAGTDRDLGATLTALTYQSLAVFDADDEVDEDGGAQSGLIEGLHDNGKALVARLEAAGPILLVLDECHHLLEVWGRLLAELLTELPEARVLGLTATPPDAMTVDQAALVAELFGTPVFEASIPAVVREGDLAPFAELVWLTEPTASERDWLAEGAERFTELTTDLTDPTFGDPAFLPWLDQRFVTRAGDAPSWAAMLREQPDLCAAALRMHHVGLLALPPGARMDEEHRRAPSADDWMLLVDDWLARQTGDDAVVTDVRRALPAVGFVLTRHGIRRGRTPVDRVLARSESKTTAAVQIVENEIGELGDGARVLLLCDHEVAGATLPADLTGVIAQQAGSARAVLAALLSSTTADDAVLVTGKTVAGSVDTLAALIAHIALTDPDLAAGLAVVPGELPTIQGRWESRTWVGYVTRFFEEGGCHVLVGTRGLLGEGWDARRVTGLVDLTSVTTSTAVVQTRGRALRTDPLWPEKVALNWSVVCVAADHPRGDNDWQRLVRKHQGFFGVDADGDVVDGVGHLDAQFSPFEAPPASDFAAIDARMLVRAQDRGVVRDRWRVGTPYDDHAAMSIRIRASRTGSLGASARPSEVAQVADRIVVRTPRPHRSSVPAVAAALVTVVGAGFLPPLLYAAAALWLVVLGRRLTSDVRRGRALVAAAAEPPSVERLAGAVADALHDAGLTAAGASALRITLDDDGDYRCVLAEVTESESGVFATALDEVVSPIVAPRYVVPRWVPLPGPVGWLDATRTANGRPRPPGGEIWHAVPTVLGQNAKRTAAFSQAWDHWVGGGPAVFTGSPEGAGVLAAQAGTDPLDVSTTMRRTWS
ncbi:MAG: box helicase [Nocardioidaceae bacterium]|nr:box helicase [Nocardioidaceae bacterium]